MQADSLHPFLGQKFGSFQSMSFQCHLLVGSHTAIAAVNFHESRGKHTLKTEVGFCLVSCPLRSIKLC